MAEDKAKDAGPTEEEIPPKVMKKLQNIMTKFDISIADAKDIWALRHYQVVMILDDSGSMRNSSLPPEKRPEGGLGPSRWHELRDTCSCIVDVATTFDETGVDMFFLNREAAYAVKGSNTAKFTNCFDVDPNGKTPLTETLEKFVKRHAKETRPTLLFILTDGEPDGGKGPFIKALKNIVSPGYGFANLHVQIMACTPDEGEVAWLDDVDRKLPRVDVTDDYNTEAEYAMRVETAEKFTRGDWAIKALLGPVTTKFDDWDLRTGRGYAIKETAVCGEGCAACTVQ